MFNTTSPKEHGYFVKGFTDRPPKYRQAIADRIEEAENSRPKNSKNRYENPDEFLLHPVDYHDAKAMLKYLADAGERSFFKRRYIISVLLATAFLTAEAALLFAICFTKDLSSILILFCIILLFVLFMILVGFWAHTLGNMIQYFVYWRSVRSGMLFEKTDPEYLVLNAAYQADVHNRFLSGKSDRKVKKDSEDP